MERSREEIIKNLNAQQSGYVMYIKNPQKPKKNINYNNEKRTIQKTCYTLKAQHIAQQS